MTDRGKFTERQRQTKYFGVPLQRILPDENPDTALVRGFFTSDDRDEEGDIITRGATERAIEKYRRWGNVRYMHLPKPVGKITRIGIDDGLAWNEVEIEVIDPQAIFEVRKGLLTALSVGISLDFDDLEFLEDGGMVISDYTLCELSLVDHPANYDAFLTSIKGAMHALSSLPLETQAQLQKEGVRMKDTKLEKLPRGGAYEVIKDKEEPLEELATTEVVVEEELLDELSATEIVEEEEEPGDVEKVVDANVESIEETDVQTSLEVEETPIEVEEPSEKSLDVEEQVDVETEEPMLEEKSPACRQSDETVEECVARKIPELMDEGMEHDQAVAAAHSICEEPCKSCPESDVEQDNEVEITLEAKIDALQAEIKQLKQDFAIASGLLKVVAEALQGQDEQSDDEDDQQADPEELQLELDEALQKNRELKAEIELLRTPVARKGHVQETELPEEATDEEEERPTNERPLKQAVRRHLEARYTARG